MMRPPFWWGASTDRRVLVRAGELWVPFTRRTRVLMAGCAALIAAVAPLIALLVDSVRGHAGLYNVDEFTPLLLILCCWPLAAFWPCRWIEIGPRGVRFRMRGAYYGDQRFPASRITAFEVRRIRPAGFLRSASKPQMCVHLTDGQCVEIDYLKRGNRSTSEPLVSSRGPGLLANWEPCGFADGQPLRWTAENDEAFASLLWQTLQEAVTRPTESAA